MLCLSNYIIIVTPARSIAMLRERESEKANAGQQIIHVLKLNKFQVSSSFVYFTFYLGELVCDMDTRSLFVVYY